MYRGLLSLMTCTWWSNKNWGVFYET